MGSGDGLLGRRLRLVGFGVVSGFGCRSAASVGRRLGRRGDVVFVVVVASVVVAVGRVVAVAVVLVVAVVAAGGVTCADVSA